MVGVLQWAEIRRMVLVEGRSQREVARLTGLARDTVARAVRCEEPPRYVRAPAGSKLDPFREWVCEQLRADPRIPAQRLRELAIEVGYEGGKTIFDEYVREVRPRYLVRRTFQRTIYRPGELVQCDLWEPRELVPVGHGQLRRGWVVTVELCWSRVTAGALIFSKEAPDVLVFDRRNWPTFQPALTAVRVDRSHAAIGRSGRGSLKPRRIKAAASSSESGRSPSPLDGSSSVHLAARARPDRRDPIRPSGRPLVNALAPPSSP